MKCAMCRHGETRPGKVTSTLQRRGATIIIKGVPGDVCDNCGEYYLSEGVTHRVLAMAEDAVRKGAEVEIIRYTKGEPRGEVAAAKG